MTKKQQDDFCFWLFSSVLNENKNQQQQRGNSSKKKWAAKIHSEFSDFETVKEENEEAKKKNKK